jgi:DNA-binding NtrC family response regulator
MKEVEILFVDDEEKIRTMVKEFLSSLGYRVVMAENGYDATRMAMERHFDLVFTDIRMPGMDGLEVLASIKEHSPETEVVMVTGHGTIESAIEATRRGCYDYLQKPIKLERLKILVERIAEKLRLKEENRLLRRQLQGRYGYDGIIGVSRQMRELYGILDQIRNKNATVLIQGESGTGKELVARVIWRNSARADKPFVPINCGSIVEGLAESEFFGHVQGAFTGALRDKEGLFEAAHGGTIFLDEVTEISSHIQVKLLRVLQEKRIRRVGETREREVDVRVIAATNRDARLAVKEGRLREDLFYRLDVVSILIPPLRERREDIRPLVEHFVERFEKEHNKKVVVSPDVMELMSGYNWPGNVRELENVVERAFVLDDDGIMTREDLPSGFGGQEAGASAVSSSLNLRDHEITLIQRAMVRAGGRKKAAASLLGIDLSTLYRKLEKYGLNGKNLQNGNGVGNLQKNTIPS